MKIFLCDDKSKVDPVKKQSNEDAYRIQQQEQERAIIQSRCSTYIKSALSSSDSSTDIPKNRRIRLYGF